MNDLDLKILEAKCCVKELETVYQQSYSRSFKVAADLARTRYKIKNPSKKDIETIIQGDDTVSEARRLLDEAERRLVELRIEANKAEQVDGYTKINAVNAELEAVVLESEDGTTKTLLDYYTDVENQIEVIEDSLSDLRSKLDDGEAISLKDVFEYTSIYIGELIDLETHLVKIKWKLKSKSLSEKLITDEIQRTKRLQDGAKRLCDYAKVTMPR